MKAWSNNKLRKYYEANSLCHKETHELIGIRLECQQRIPYESIFGTALQNQDFSNQNKLADESPERSSEKNGMKVVERCEKINGCPRMNPKLETHS